MDLCHSDYLVLSDFPALPTGRIRRIFDIDEIEIPAASPVTGFASAWLWIPAQALPYPVQIFRKICLR